MGHLHLYGDCAQPGVELYLQSGAVLHSGTYLQSELPNLLVCVQPGGVPDHGGDVPEDIHLCHEEDVGSDAPHQWIYKSQKDADKTH